MSRIAAALLGLIGLFAAAPTLAFDPARLGHLAEAVEFNGVILVSRGDTVVYARAFGHVSPNAEARHQLDGRWRWASITKQVVATLVMQEVEEGRIDLDAPIARYWPDFANAERETITIRHLMQHMSGLPIPDDTAALPTGLPAFYAVDGAESVTTDSHCAGPVESTPGTRYSYNNCDFLVLGGVLERVTDMALQDLVAERIPGSPTFFPDGRPTIPGYHFGQEEPPIRFQSYGAAGGLNGTIFDLWQFDRALMTGALLGEATREQMWDGDPAIGHHALGQWALEVGLAGCAAPVRVIERLGAIGGVQTRNYMLPESDITVIAFTNRSEGEFSFGRVWAGEGFTHDLLAEAACHWEDT